MFLWTVVLPFCIHVTIATNTSLNNTTYQGEEVDEQNTVINGKAIKIINENYGIAADINPKGASFQMLADSLDPFLGNTGLRARPRSPTRRRSP